MEGGLCDRPVVRLLHEGFQTKGRFRGIVETGDHAERFSARFEEDFLAADLNLFERFKAVTKEGRADHGQLFDSLRGKITQCLFGIGFEPLGATEARLK